MKKYILIVLLSLVPLFCSAQKRIYTKKALLADFTTKTTKVVMSGNTILDLSLRNEVMSRWHISPYEFCEYSDYEAQKLSTDFYFLRIMQDANYTYLSLGRGGKDSDEDPRKESFTVVDIPIAPSASSVGRELIFMPAFLDIIQVYVEDAICSDRVAYMGLGAYSTAITKTSARAIFFADSDLSSAFKDNPKESFFDGSRLILTTEDSVDNVFNNAQPGAVVSLTLSPASNAKGISCYKMLIAADTHELIYYKKMMSVGASSKGFSTAEVKAISIARRKAE